MATVIADVEIYVGAHANDEPEVDGSLATSYTALHQQNKTQIHVQFPLQYPQESCHNSP